MTDISLLFSLIRSELFEETPDDAVKAHLSEDVLERLFGISEKLDLAHILEQALNKLNLLNDNDISRKYKEASVKALYRYVQNNQIFTSVCALLERIQIPFVPLKGSVIRPLYPKPWLRTSCDIDILVCKKDLDRAVSALVNDHGFRYDKYDFHDVSLYAPNNVHLELHYTLLEDSGLTQSQNVLKTVWDRVIPVKENSFQMQMTDEMFYFYHILHMAHHFYEGGCGLRPFLDIWILNHKVPCNQDAREKLLAEGNLLTFGQNAYSAAETWLNGTASDPMQDAMLEYVLYGGVYGNLSNRAAVGQAKSGNKVKYMITRRIFRPYVFLKEKYPVLEKHKWLTPWYQIVRWKDILMDRGVKDVAREMKNTTTVSSETISSATDLLKHLGL